jgi:hypothetical protein
MKKKTIKIMNFTKRSTAPSVPECHKVDPLSLDHVAYNLIVIGGMRSIIYADKAVTQTATLSAEAAFRLFLSIIRDIWR